MNTNLDAGNLRPQLFNLADRDRQCLRQIRAACGFTSDALTIRIAIRALANSLTKEISEPEIKKLGTKENNNDGGLESQ